jgi:hypothetical protein
MSLLLYYRRFDYENAIKKLATLLWMEQNCPPDRDLEFWTKAESLIKLQI